MELERALKKAVFGVSSKKKVDYETGTSVLLQLYFLFRGGLLEESTRISSQHRKEALKWEREYHQIQNKHNSTSRDILRSLLSLQSEINSESQLSKANMRLNNLQGEISYQIAFFYSDALPATSEQTNYYLNLAMEFLEKSIELDKDRTKPDPNSPASARRVHNQLDGYNLHSRILLSCAKAGHYLMTEQSPRYSDLSLFFKEIEDLPIITLVKLFTITSWIAAAARSKNSYIEYSSLFPELEQELSRASMVCDLKLMNHLLELNLFIAVEKGAMYINQVHSSYPPLDKVSNFLSLLQEAQECLRWAQNSDASSSTKLVAIKALARGLELRAILLEARLLGKEKGEALLRNAVAVRRNTGIYFITDCILAEISVQLHCWSKDSHFDSYFSEYDRPMDFKPNIASLYKVAAYIEARSYFSTKNNGTMEVSLVKLIRTVDFEKAYSSRITQEWWNSALYTVATFMLEITNKQNLSITEDLQLLDPVLLQAMEAMAGTFKQPAKTTGSMPDYKEEDYYQSDDSDDE